MTYVVLEAGSTHMGKKAYVKELIERSKECGADAVKFQLFPNTREFTASGNVYMTDDLYAEANAIGKQVGIDIFASVFTQTNVDVALTHKPKYVKFAYSMAKHRNLIDGLLSIGHNVIVSCDQSNVFNFYNLQDMTKHENLSLLFCVPKYPVYELLDFDGIFWSGLYDGFSDHTLGIEQSCLLKGLDILEKHVTLGYADVTCPDRSFAISFDQAKEMIKRIRDK